MPPATEQVRGLATHIHHTLSWRVNTASSACCRRRQSTHATCKVVASLHAYATLDVHIPCDARIGISLAPLLSMSDSRPVRSRVSMCKSRSLSSGVVASLPAYVAFDGCAQRDARIWRAP
jgi:hypothetical protein